jgi:hypothetical protein
MGKFIDLTGKKFGRLTVIKRDTSVDSKKGAFWLCRCDCGNEKSISSNALRNGATQSCGCLNKEIISKPKDLSDMIGKKFGKLTVVQRNKTHITSGGQKKVMWLCRCDCGNEKVVASQDLKSGHTKSCGCISTKKKGSGLIDLTGQRFGKLVVVERTEDYVCKHEKRILLASPRWLCQCDCGNIAIVQGGNLRSGNTTNCGCKKTTSKGERLIADFLINNNIKFLREYSFDDLRNKSGNLLRFDFAILNNKNNVIMLVEYQGEQHYIDCGSFGSYQRKYSDKMKRDYCKLNKISLYEIRFDDDLEYVLYDLLNEIEKYNEIEK